MPFFVGVDEGGYVAVVLDHAGTLPEDGVGPPSPVPTGPYTYHETAPEEFDIVKGQGTPTSRLARRAGALVWMEGATLEQLRIQRNAAINVWKLEANSSYFEFAGEQIAYRDSDRIEIQAVHNWVTLTGTMPAWPDWPAAWKAISNRWVPLPDVDTWTAFTLAIAERGTAHFKRAQILKARVTAAATAEELESITW